MMLENKRVAIFDSENNSSNAWLANAIEELSKNIVELSSMFDEKNIY